MESLSGKSPAEALRTYMSSLPTPTAVSQSIRVLTRMILLHSARAYGSSHILLGTTLTSLSISLISSVSQGGGFTVREEREEEWMMSLKGNGIRVVTPLRDVGIKECAAWLWWAKLRTVTVPPQNIKEQGIGKLTQGDSFDCRLSLPHGWDFQISLRAWNEIILLPCRLLRGRLPN